MGPRLIIFGLIAGLIALLSVLIAQLPKDLRALSTAETDNTQWSVFQVETEFANLSATLAQQALAAAPDTDWVKLRADIALSRANIVTSGRNRILWVGNEEAEALLEQLRDFQASVAQILDQNDVLGRPEIADLRKLTQDIRPNVRRLALVGLQQGAQLSENRRDVFIEKLRWLGLVAIVLIAAFALALLYLAWLLAAARRKDEDLRSTSQRLAVTVSASLDGIVIANAHGEIIEFNGAASNIFGWSKAEILGQKMDQTIVPMHHRAGHAAGMKRYLSTGTPHVVGAGRIELSALRKTGEEFPIELNITSAMQNGEEIFIAYIRDISKQKISEQKLIDARDQAKRTDLAKSHFLAVMSHEMRTPLNGILGVLDLLKTTKLDKQQDRYVQVAAASGEILLEHINEALDITRIETGVMSLSPERFSLRQTVNRVADVLRTLATEKGLTLQVDFDPGMDRDFKADPVRVNQILTNLIGNAIKFTKTGGITLKVAGIHGPETTEATIVVTDTGPGIADENIEDIFQDFVALARPSGRQSRGDGLGLSISRKVARLMGGDLTAHSVVGQGSAFTLTLPLTRCCDDLPEISAQTTIANPKVGSVLIVEDNAINRSVLGDMLIGFGSNVTEAKDGLEGLKTAEETKFDLIVMDISMPFMDGIEVTRRIRQGDGPNKSTYILGLTAHGRQEYRDKAKAAGMEGFCTKPIRLSDLRATLDGIPLQGGADPQQTGLFAHDVLSELRDALGDQKTHKTAQAFFVELTEGVTKLREKSDLQQESAITDILHKLRGAAALLGLNALSVSLSKVSDAQHSQNQTAYEKGLHQVEHDASVTAKALNLLLDTTND
ncbi:ATP-binding protein [Aestuariibius sp. HNIBRBA575]|uniref:hybrid sensor histidine kinase/response regulator n=1 Tax=Aestuariibius sp. HNIBRBA575 TaxID=3233343 RepID=UPI0034A4F9E1